MSDEDLTIASGLTNVGSDGPVYPKSIALSTAISEGVSALTFLMQIWTNGSIGLPDELKSAATEYLEESKERLRKRFKHLKEGETISANFVVPVIMPCDHEDDDDDWWGQDRPSETVCTLTKHDSDGGIVETAVFSARTCKDGTTKTLMHKRDTEGEDTALKKLRWTNVNDQMSQAITKCLNDHVKYMQTNQLTTDCRINPSCYDALNRMTPFILDAKGVSPTSTCTGTRFACQFFADQVDEKIYPSLLFDNGITHHQYPRGSTEVGFGHKYSKG